MWWGLVSMLPWVPCAGCHPPVPHQSQESTVDGGEMDSRWGGSIRSQSNLLPAFRTYAQLL